MEKFSKILPIKMQDNVRLFDSVRMNEDRYKVGGSSLLENVMGCAYSSNLHFE